MGEKKRPTIKVEKKTIITAKKNTKCIRFSITCVLLLVVRAWSS